MDPLSDVLSLLQPRSHVSAGFDAGGDWSVAFTGNVGIKCYAVASGECWLAVEGVAEAVHLKAGDCFLLPSGRPFRIASDLALTPMDSTSVFPPAQAGGVVRWNGGGAVFLVGSRFTLAGQHADMLLGMLPPIVHIRKKTEQAALRWSIERMMQELHAEQAGSYLMAQHLAHMMLLQALRVHMTRGMEGGVGWLFALADKQIGAALRAMHADPARSWSLQDLAQHACMSRSAFAHKFKTAVGASAMDYLTRWRMLLAADRLARTPEPLSAIALSLGYESESAFGTAFKRVMGSSPRQYGRTSAPADTDVGHVSQEAMFAALGA